MTTTDLLALIDSTINADPTERKVSELIASGLSLSAATYRVYVESKPTETLKVWFASTSARACKQHKQNELYRKLSGL